MTRRIMACLLTLTPAGALATPLAAQQPTQPTRDKQAERIKKRVKGMKRWDVGDPITVKLNDGTTIKGHITEAADDYFVVVDKKTGHSSSIEYGQVTDIREGMGTRTKIGIAFGGAVLAIVGICAASHRCRE